MSISKNSENPELDKKRHSVAHLLAAAIQNLFPEAQFGVGPVIDNGCYYDFILPRTLIPEDLPLIEDKMRSFFKRDLAYKVQTLSLEKALELFANKGQKLKVELLLDLKNKGTTKLDETEAEIFGENTSSTQEESASSIPAISQEGNADASATPKITVYRIIDEVTGETLFEDLCKGPHVEHIRELAKLGFKLDKFSGAYWRGNQERNIQMQRIYALVFETQTELDEFLNQREEAKKRDHRIIGQQMDLFTFSELVGKGLPLFTPNGTVLREKLNALSQSLREELGFKKVYIPHIAKQELYEKSGHWAKFGDEWLTVTSQETTDKLVMKPMNCPHHQQIFDSKPRSYKDLPIKYLETTTVYRDEKAGELLGLSRVRSITQDDSHIFCSEDQIEEVYDELIALVVNFYQQLGINLKVRLSFRDINKLDDYLGEKAVWDKAEKILENLAKKHKLDYFPGPGEAAFYGPKLDFIGVDVLGREWQLATPQLDFIQPKRFGLSYTTEDGKEATPVLIHFALMGSLERFLSVYIEHTGGRFPFWLAPVQVKILTINNQVLAYAQKIKQILSEVVLMKPLKYNELRFEVDDRNESLGKKIREAEVQKVPVILIVGPKDMEAEQVSVRTREGESKVRLEELALHIERL